MPPTTRARNRIQPGRAYRAVRALFANPDDTGQVFIVIGALSGNSGERLYRRFRRHAVGRRILKEKRQLIEVLSDRDALLSLPPGTLGRCYGEFMQREEISADGLVDASREGVGAEHWDEPERALVGARVRDMHDLWHVVTGYNRDIRGELALLAFTVAQTRNPGIAFIVAMAYYRISNPVVRKLIRDALRRGRRSAWLPAQDWEALLAQPLEQVRGALGVGDPPRYEENRSQGAPALPAAS